MKRWVVMWPMLSVLSAAWAATPAQELRLRLWPGTPTASGPAPLTYGRVRLVSEASGWAFTITHVLNARTGKQIGLSTGNVVYLDGSVFDLECATLSIPYCGGDPFIIVDRVNFREAKPTHRELLVPTVPNCTYREGAVRTTTRHSPRYVDALIEASCGYVFARYDWAAKSKLPIKTLVVKSKTWLLPYPK